MITDDDGAAVRIAMTVAAPSHVDGTLEKVLTEQARDGGENEVTLIRRHHTPVVQAIAKPLICAKLFPRTIQSHHDKSVVTPYPPPTSSPVAAPRPRPLNSNSSPASSRSTTTSSAHCAGGRAWEKISI
jgi:hypothetical protein